MKLFYHLKTALLLLFLAQNALLSAQTVAVNEVMSSNSSTIADNDGDYSDWIELYNYGNTTVNLGGIGLSDNETQPFKWVLPSVILQPNQFLIVWASGKNRNTIGQPLHTNFSISSAGEPIVLTHPNGTTLSSAPSVQLYSNISIGRQPDGTGDWFFFLESTPNAPNIGEGLNELIAPPNFSHESGFFNQPIELVLTHPNPNAVIIYTTDGSEPNMANLNGTVYEYKNEYPIQTNALPFPTLTDSFTSKIFDAPFWIEDRSGFPDELAAKNTRQHLLHVPPNPVRKATVIRAVAYVDNQPSQTVSKTYFVWPLGNPYDLPIISIQTQENYMFDYENGTYNAGIRFDEWRENNPNNNQYYRPEWGNYWRRGAEWEYPCNVEIFEPNNFEKVLSTGAGWRIHGNNSRSRLIKNMRLYARGAYGQNYFNYNLFDHAIFDVPNPDADRFKRILLRGDGSGGRIAYDVVMNRVMPYFYNGVTRIKPAVQFINGEFWGVTAIRDRMDQHHYDIFFNINPDNFVQVDCKGNNCGLDYGTSADYSDYNNLRNYIINNDMANQTHFDSVTKRLEINSFIDHMVLQIFSADDSYERYFWKSRIPTDDKYGDGRWRVSTQDFEASLKSGTNWVEYMSNINISSNESLHGNLLENENYRNAFLNRFADMLNTVMSTQHFNQIVQTTFAEVEPYLDEDFNRSPKIDFYKDSDKTNLLNWGNTRPEGVRDQLRTFFGINSIVDLTLKISEDEAGEIKINTIEITPATPSISNNPYPWVGKYFENIPITVVATAKPGYTFSHWSGDVSGTDPSLTFTPTEHMEIQANFNPIINNRDVIYFWMMDGEIPNNTPLESLAATYASNGLEAIIQYESCLDGYPFTESDPNWRRASMERRNAPTPINYRPSANGNAPYLADDMRGIQIRQPFKQDNLENTMILEVPTTNLHNILLTFASESDGAAQSIIIDYWNGSSWSNNNLSNPTKLIGASYTLISCDFSDVEIANNNEDFKIRLRFDGENMFASDGLRVHFNNIAIEGEPILSTEKSLAVVSFNAYPNPTNSNLTIETSETVQILNIYNMYGQLIKSLNPNSTQFEVDLSGLPKGVYLFNANWKEGTKTFRIIKQ